jgi:hypothetical protein
MYRMFIDEVGHASLRACTEATGRYLHLCAIVFRLDVHDGKATSWVERLKKKHFTPLQSGKPIILHRKELVNGEWPFGALRDPIKRERFNQNLVTTLTDLDYMILTATIDKLEHLRSYQRWHHHPYHYCAQVILERYVMWLNQNGARGDIFAESRGRRDDFELKKAVRRLYYRGTDVVSREAFQRALLSEDIKLFRKGANIAGLQLADLIAHPTFKWMMARKAKQAQPDTFGAKVARIMEENKYRRSPKGAIDGWGCKWLP